MVIYRGFYVTTCVLISLCGLAICQYGDDDYNLPQEKDFPKLPILGREYTPEPEIDPNSPIKDLFEKSTSKSYVSKEGTSEPEPTTSQTTTKEPAEPAADFRWSDADGNVCVRALIRAKFEIPYAAEDDNGLTIRRTTYIPLTNKAWVGGDCGEGKKDNPQLILQWGQAKYIFKMQFSKTRSGDTDDWLVDAMEFTYDTRDKFYFQAAIDAGEVTVSIDKKAEYFESPWRSSYVCKADDKIEMNSEDKINRIFLKIDEIQLQPFMQPQQNGTFSEAELCENDKQKKPTSNVASVAVGATLGCLILIVIIVYAVGRRMGTITDRTGYKAVE